MEKILRRTFCVLFLSMMHCTSVLAYTQEDAAAEVANMYGFGGSVIGVSSTTVDGRAYYRIVVLLSDGLRRVHLVDAITGKIIQ